MICCIMCRAFVTRSLETCSGFCAGEAVAEESSPSLPSTAPTLLPSSGSLPLGVTGGAAVAHGRWGHGVPWSRERKGGKQIVEVPGFRNRESPGRSRDLCPGLWARLALRLVSKVFPFLSFLFSAYLVSTFLYRLAASLRALLPVARDSQRW